MDKKAIVNFLFEAGILSKTPRSGLYFLGSGVQSVAEHLHRTGVIGYALAKLDGNVDTGKILAMCLLHDFNEARISDLNYVHQKYTERYEDRAVEDLVQTLPFGEDMRSLLHEYEERESKEAIYVKDADNLEWILTLKEQLDVGNSRAMDWIKPSVKRLKTDLAKALAEVILQTDSNDWWHGNKDDEWWISRNKN